MNLTQKDKITLGVLVIVLSLFIGLWFIIKPAWGEVQDNKKKYNELKGEYATLQTELQNKENVKEQVQDKYDECAEMSKMFYSDEKDRELAHQVVQQLESVGIVVTGQTTAHATKILSPYRYRDNELSIPSSDYANINEDEQSKAAALIAPQTVGCYTYNIEFREADRDKIFKFIENLTTYDHTTMVVTSLSFEVSDMEKEEAPTTPAPDEEDDDENKPVLEEDHYGEGSITLELYYMKAPEEPIID